MLDLFRHRRAPDVKERQEDHDLGNLGEVLAYPPHGLPSDYSADPCDEMLPTPQCKEPRNG